MTFFGLRTESQKVLFVLDVSGSMDFPMRTYTNDKENSGETRISVAKRELLQALAGIREGGMFNIVLYSNDVWSWSDEPVVMSVETRAEVTTFVEELTVMGGTNLYGAIKGGLDACRGEARRKDVGTPKWITPVYDTIFLLSDGAPSVGISTDREDILDMAAEENSDLSVTINSIGLSSEQDAILMRRLAEQTGGKYVAR
jgi:Mg-chelatase subunit ChlD